MTWDLAVEHIGGIVSAEVTLEPGVNAVKASNWQGKSSFVDALKTVLGVARPLTDGAQQGHVHYRGPERTGTVELTAGEDGVERSGGPYLEDEYDVVRARLFACLGEANEVRAAVRAGDDLAQTLLRPLDFENIDARIEDRKRERDRIDSERTRAQEAKNRLPAIQERVTRLESEIASLREQRDELAEGDDADASAQDDLAQAESEYDRVENRVDRLADSLERTESKLDAKREELASMETLEDDEVASQLEETRETLADRRRDKTVLESVHSATEMVISEGRLDLVTDIQRELAGDTLDCWTCGAETETETVESRLAALRERVASVTAEVGTLQERVEQLEAKRERVAQNRKRRETLERDIAQLEEKRADDRASLADARDRLTDLQERIDGLSAAVDESRDRLTDVESDLKYREAELEDARSDLADLEARAADLERLEAERETVVSELERLRDRKSTVRRETRAAFDRQLGAVLDRFDTGFETARLTPEFDLIVARDGRETTLNALSEGERELLGFAAALAGYETFEVADVSPFLLVDRVGGLADDNRRALVEYLRGTADYLVVTTYPEHDTGRGNELDPSQWQVASN